MWLNHSVNIGCDVATPKQVSIGDQLCMVWIEEVKSLMQSHTEVILREGIVPSLCGSAADLVQYLGPQAQMSELINKIELVYGTMASFNILM